MVREVRVKQGFHSNEYDTLSDAVAVAANNTKLDKSKCNEINGKIVQGYQFNGTVLIIGFDNKKYLIVSPGVNKIDWDVVSTKPRNANEAEIQKTYFVYPSGEKILWNWKEILDNFVGKQIAISPSDQYLFIFTRGGAEYMFDVLVNKEKITEKFLDISES